MCQLFVLQAVTSIMDGVVDLRSVDAESVGLEKIALNVFLTLDVSMVPALIPGHAIANQDGEASLVLKNLNIVNLMKILVKMEALVFLWKNQTVASFVSVLQGMRARLARVPSPRFRRPKINELLFR